MYTELDSTFNHDGQVYNLTTLLQDTEKLPTIEIKVRDLQWMLDGSGSAAYDQTRFEQADLSAPILVTRWRNKLAVIDGWHRFNKAVAEGVETLPAKLVPEKLLTKHLLRQPKKPIAMQTTNTDPYGLTTTRAIRIDPIRTEIAKQAIVDRNNNRIFRITEEHREIGEFEHPILFKTPSVDGWRIAIDTRPYRGSSPMVREQLGLLLRRAAITLHCAQKESLEELYETGLMMAYVTTITTMMAKQYNLDPLMRSHISIVACAFYYYITRPDNHVPNDEDYLIVAKQAVRHLKQPADMVESVLTHVQPGRDLEALVNSIKAVEGTDRTLTLSPAALINCCNSLWFGINKDQLLGIMLEHPPTWAAIVYEATGDGTYSRVELAKRLKGNNLLRQKIPHMHSIINQIVAEYETDGYDLSA